MSAFNRMFGKAKEKAPPPSLTDAITRTEGMGDSIQKKVDKLNAQLKTIHEQMKKMPNGPAKNRMKQRALMILRQKKQYESQGMNIQQQIFNMDQQNFAIESVKSTKETVAAMQHGVKALKAEFKTMSLDNVDDVMDDMADLMDDTNEMQEIMAQTYGAPECDESELEAELACLDDLNFEDDSIFSEIEAPAGGLEVPAAAEPAKVAEGEDDYGLPALPS
eukprot:m.166057 g.166057  ORF g.166057 m.166057 type:complete len:220 (+) comp12641_c0_seq1:91-750(+)